MLRDADFEVALRWRGDGSFDVSLGYDDPNDVAAKRQYGVKLIVIDLGPLSLLLADQRAYGERLTEVLFAADDTVATFDSKAKAVAENQDIPLHFRLYVDPAAPSNYLRVRWELLRDPEDNSVIATKRNCLFSRFLSHADWRALAPPKKHDLRALVAIANGRNLGEYTPRHSSLPQVDVNGELARARDALSDTRLIELASDGKATLEQIVDALEMGVDILYLVCHGSIVGGRSVLYLERADGSVHPAFGDELATRIADLRRRPTLAVLCSCNSAGPGEEGMTSDNGDLVPLGPSLAASGVAAVVAMQGNVTIQTAGAFLTAFFKALKHDGVVDRAATVARAAVSNRPDWWMPVLFSRLKRGRTYYLPEFAERGDVEGADSEHRRQALHSGDRPQPCGHRYRLQAGSRAAVGSAVWDAHRRIEPRGSHHGGAVPPSAQRSARASQRAAHLSPGPPPGAVQGRPTPGVTRDW